jgi:hypothetical protein
MPGRGGQQVQYASSGDGLSLFATLIIVWLIALIALQFRPARREVWKHRWDTWYGPLLQWWAADARALVQSLIVDPAQWLWRRRRDKQEVRTFHAVIDDEMAKLHRR